MGSKGKALGVPLHTYNLAGFFVGEGDEGFVIETVVDVVGVTVGLVVAGDLEGDDATVVFALNAAHNACPIGDTIGGEKMRVIVPGHVCGIGNTEIVIEVSGNKLAGKASGNVGVEIVAHFVSGVPAESDRRGISEIGEDLIEIFEIFYVLESEHNVCCFCGFDKASKTLDAEIVRSVSVHSDYGMNDHYRDVGALTGVQTADKKIGLMLTLFAFLPKMVNLCKGRVHRLIDKTVFSDCLCHFCDIRAVAVATGEAAVKSGGFCELYRVFEGILISDSDSECKFAISHSFCHPFRLNFCSSFGLYEIKN